VKQIWQTQKMKNVERMPMIMEVHDDAKIKNQAIAKIIHMAG
jgi:hypothetical protein